MRNKFHSIPWAMAIIVAVGLLFSLTFRQGHNWGGDFSLYIMHAINLHDGLPYAETPFIPNLEGLLFTPVAYPPGFPALLVPIYHFFGLDLVAMKCLLVVSFVLALAVLAVAWRQELSFKSWLALLIIVGLNFQYWNAKDQIISDFPFMFFTFAALALGQWLIHHQDNRKTAFLWGIAAGLLCYLSFATRTIGVVTPGAVLASFLWQTRRFNLLFMSVLLTFVTLAGLQTILIPGNSDYLAILKHTDLTSFMVHIIDTGKRIALFWDNGFTNYFREISGIRLGLFSHIKENNPIHYLRYPVLVMTLVPMLALTLVTLWWAIRGMMHSVTKEVSPWFFFMIFYLIVILAWYSVDQRYLFPIFPILLFFAFQYVDQVDQRRKRFHKRSWLSLFLVIVALTYMGKYQKVARDFEAHAHGPFAHEAQAAFDYIRRNTPENATFLFRKPRVLALLTGRRAGHSPSSQPHAVWQFAQNIKADYLLVDRITDVDNRENMAAFVQTSSHKLRMIFENNQFTLYELIKGS